MTDQDVIQILWPNKICLLERCKERLTDDILQYLKNRFKYSESLYETLFCIKHNIDRDNKICPVCGKGILKFNGNKRNDYFIRGCCKECIYKLRNFKSIETSNARYGTTHPRKNKEKNKEINQKRENTYLTKFGVIHNSQLDSNKEKIRQTSLKHFGTEHPFQSKIVKDKIHNTCLNKYGTDWTFQDELTKEKQKATLLKKYGVTNSFCIPDVIKSLKERKNEIQQKRDNTKRKNKTFGASIPEQKTYLLLVEKFGKNDVLRQYKSDVYPFNCDFYLISEDIYIECNYFWTHQGHFFNKDDANDIKILKEMSIKGKDHPFYLGAINTWMSDLNKQKVAKSNKLNYIVFWNINEAINWINNYE